MSINIRAWIFS